jgi:hypothetical protein
MTVETFPNQYGGALTQAAMPYSVKITETRLRKSMNLRKTWKNRVRNANVVRTADGILLPIRSSENARHLQQKYRKRVTRRNRL